MSMRKYLFRFFLKEIILYSSRAGILSPLVRRRMRTADVSAGGLRASRLTGARDFTVVDAITAVRFAVLQRSFQAILPAALLRRA